jgi:hypothetical protein
MLSKRRGWFSGFWDLWVMVRGACGYGRVPCDFDSRSKAGERGGVFDELSWVKAWKHTFRSPIYRHMFGYHSLFCPSILFRFLCKKQTMISSAFSHILGSYCKNHGADETAAAPRLTLLKFWPVWKFKETEWNQYFDVANVKGLDSGRKKQIKKQICLQYSVIVVIGGNELSSSILSEKPTSHSTYPTLPCSVLFAMTTWQRQEED